MSDEDFKKFVRDSLTNQSNKFDELRNYVHKMEIEQTALKTKFGLWWVGLAALNVSGVDLPFIASFFGG